MAHNRWLVSWSLTRHWALMMSSSSALGASIPEPQARGAQECVGGIQVLTPSPLFGIDSLQTPVPRLRNWFPLSHEETMRNELYFRDISGYLFSLMFGSKGQWEWGWQGTGRIFFSESESGRINHTARSKRPSHQLTLRLNSYSEELSLWVDWIHRTWGPETLFYGTIEHKG